MTAEGQNGEYELMREDQRSSNAAAALQSGSHSSTPQNAGDSEADQRFELTESAKLSNSCPSMLLLFLHLATLPSKRSKIAPNSGNHRAIQACFGSDVRRYLAEENKD